MDPSVRLALLDLDDRTPAFFVDEMFAHARLDTLYCAQAVLATGIESRGVLSKSLSDRLRIVPIKSADGEDD